LAFVVYGLGVMKERDLKSGRNIFNLLFFMIVYLTAYPSILALSILKMVTKRYSW